MTAQSRFVNQRLPAFWHGGDYNPEQWKHVPGLWDEDMRLMKLANCNVMSIGIFSWAQLEPEEGKFDFSWLDEILEKMYKNGIHAALATPSGARAAWLSQKYPEVLRVGPSRVRNLHHGRHNHCFTSPIYREKVAIINRKIAERYKDHPAVVLWHVSNEYSGDCHCDYCQEAFRQWLKNKYQTLENLNLAWWTHFWSHTFTDWSQIESPGVFPHGEGSIHGMNLDWKRFVTDQTVDFFKHEIKPLKELAPNIPVTTNLMGMFPGLNYWKLAEQLDVVSWDSYPRWHTYDDVRIACETAFTHDIMRSLKRKPFLLIESTPSITNWAQVCKQKRPGMHRLASLQAVAHGSDSVMYFQWRKSRGSIEKFHGAVVDHCGHENTRVFREVSALGKELAKIQPVLGTSSPAEAAVIFDWENRWALEDAKGPRQQGRDYPGTCINHYQELWQRGIPVDVINQDCDFSPYKLIIAPMSYMVRPGVAERLEEFVRKGGTFVTTYWSGLVNENDLCFLGGFPGPLRQLLGIWVEETDALTDEDYNTVTMLKNNPLGLQGTYRAGTICDVVHAETAEVLATFDQDYYAGYPALTVNNFGQGKAYFIASRNEQAFHQEFYQKILAEQGLTPVINAELPRGVTVQRRVDGEQEYVFLMNFSTQEQVVQLGNQGGKDLLSDEMVEGTVKLEPYGVRIWQRSRPNI